MKQKLHLEAVQKGSILFVGVSLNADEIVKFTAQMRKKLIPGGNCIQFKDGTQEWIEDEPIFDASKTGSEAYIWHKDGNRVKNKRFFVTKHKGEKPERTFLKFVWKDFGEE